MIMSFIKINMHRVQNSTINRRLEATVSIPKDHNIQRSMPIQLFYI
jgi:hypothetical protein